MNQRLEGKVAIITGAATGIGEAIAHKFAKEGAKFVVNGLPQDPVEAVADSINQHGGEAWLADKTLVGPITIGLHLEF